MSNIDKQWLQQKIADMEATRDEIPFGLDEDDSNTLAALRIALASLEAEPVSKSVFNINHESSLIKHVKKVVRDTSSPPAPVSVPDVLERLRSIVADPRALPRRKEWISGQQYSYVLLENVIAMVDEACRTAMLQGADGKPELTVWYGAMPETNGKTNWTAILHRKGECLSTGITIDRSEYPDRVRYEADRLRYLIGESDKRPCIIDYDANAHSGYVEPVTTTYKLPEGAISALTLALQAMEFMGDTLNNLNAVYEEDIEFVTPAFEAVRSVLNGNSPVIPDCWCQTCRPVKLNDMRFVVCPECGNKRCPHANDHRNACTGSNEPGQEGSAYPAAPQQEVK